MSSPETPRRRRRGWRLAFALAPLLVVALALLGLEVWARATREADPNFTPDPWRQYVLLPGHSYTSTGYWGEMRVTINAHGHRGPELAAEKPPQGYRVVCLGGSQAFGFGSSADATAWPARLGAELQAARPARKVEVLNGGVPGWNVRTALTDYQLELRGLRFDLAVVCEAYNDLQETASTRYCSASFASDPTDLLARRGALEKLLGWSEAFKSAVRWLTSKRIGYLKLPGPTPEGEEAYARNLHTAVRALRADGLAVVLCTYPHLYRMPEADLRALLGEKRLEGTLKRTPLTYAGAQLGLQRMNEHVREVARSESVLLCDLESVVPAQAELWVDPIHLSDKGAEIVGKEVARVVLEAKLLPESEH